MNKRIILTHGSILLFIGLVAFGPLLLALTAFGFAGINDCVLHEGYPNPCVVFGFDWGETLYAYSVSAWITLFTLPLGIFFLGIYMVAMMVRWRRKNDPRPPAN